MAGLGYLVYVLLGFLLALAKFKLPRKHDAQEPPLVPAGPLGIGHVVGIARQGKSAYFPGLWKNSHLPIFTISLPFGFAKFYVVNSQSLVPVIQRNARTLGFEAFHTMTTQKGFGMTAAGLELIKEERMGGAGLGVTINHGMRTCLTGHRLEGMFRMMFDGLLQSLEELESRGDSVDLYGWCKDVIGTAATDSVYGSMNPFRSKTIMDAFWTLERKMSALLHGPCPRMFAKNALDAREKIVQAYLNYQQIGGLKSTSHLTSWRWKQQAEAGASLESIARLELTVPLALMSNTIPGTFWFIFDIMSRPALLHDIRSELRTNAFDIDSSTGIHIISLTSIRQNCPLLLSTFQEVLRTRSVSASLRYVYNDMILGERYLLKKDAIVQVPSGPLHTDHLLWGADAGAFAPRRFIRTELEESNGNKIKAPPQDTGAYLPFGFAPSMCPGRHLATGEILALTAMLILRFDIVPERGWTAPGEEEAATGTFMVPKEAYKVMLDPRTEFIGKNWAYSVGGGDNRFPLLGG